MNRLVALLLALSLAGCIVFDKKSEGVTFHQFTAQVAAPKTSQPLVFVARATLPGPVRRPAVVIVTQGGEVQLDDSHRWAAPVDRLVAETLARHLTRLAGTPTVLQAPEAAHLTLLIECESFEVVPERRAGLTINYRFEKADGSAVAGGRTTSTEPMKELTAAAFVAAQSLNLAKAGQAIAETLRALPASQFPTR